MNLIVVINFLYFQTWQCAGRCNVPGAGFTVVVLLSITEVLRGLALLILELFFPILHSLIVQIIFCVKWEVMLFRHHPQFN